MFILNSCSNSNKLLGCWEDNHSAIITLQEDGTLIRNSNKGNWKLIDNDRLNFIWSDGRNETHTIVKLNNNLMVIKYNGLLEFTWNKVKCEDSQITETGNTEVTNNSEADTSAITFLPASEYFKVVNITKSQFIENGQFEMECEILNNTNFTFSRFDLYAEILFTMKDSDEICTSTVQFDKCKPDFVENWKQYTNIKFYFVTPCWSCGGGCFSAKYERTPEKIVLVLKPHPAISVDLEVTEAFATYDLLPLWKERQVKEGLR